MTSNVIRKVAYARENGFYKVEQEADLHRHRKRLIAQGRLEDLTGSFLRPKRNITFQESAQAFEVQAEILQQHARVDNPHPVDRQEFVRRFRAELPKLSHAELLEYRASLYGVAATAHVPRVSLGRTRWSGGQPTTQSNSSPQAVMPQTPQAREAARRVYSAGARSLAYGSALGVAGFVVLGSLTAWGLGIMSAEHLQGRAQAAVKPIATSARTILLPLKMQLEGWVEGLMGSERLGDGAYEGSGQQFRDDLSRRLQASYGLRQENPELADHSRLTDS